ERPGARGRAARRGRARRGVGHPGVHRPRRRAHAAGDRLPSAHALRLRRHPVLERGTRGPAVLLDRAGRPRPRRARGLPRPPDRAGGRSAASGQDLVGARDGPRDRRVRGVPGLVRLAFPRHHVGLRLGRHRLPDRDPERARPGRRRADRAVRAGADAAAGRCRLEGPSGGV
ncbi:MAG: hypothetical protein AVDCRST_MAG04-713, partial [uncultured Acetobacteraceae bacterium]